MNKSQQAAYQAMKTGFTALSPSFLVPRLEPWDLSDIFFKLRLDCPEIFYVVNFKYRTYGDSPNIQMIPEYLFEKGKIREHQKAMKARVEKLARQAEKLGEWEKEKYIHDFICENVHYDKLKKPYSHEIIGPLGHGVGVCEGIAKAVKILCDALGIWCIIVISEANPEKNIKYRHAWNMVRIGGKMYHLDATFDNTLSKTEIRYDYFNLDDKSIFRDHQPLIAKVPPCLDGGRFYYLEKKLSFTKQEDVAKRTAQAVKKGRTLTFHWRGGYLTREVLDQLLTIIEDSAKTKMQHARVSLNWPQAVLSVSFTPELTEEMMTLEEANEGEKN
ncbi:MAG: peptidase [Clostridiales bacterium]|nr:peptidase [Clostridiales bacterium]